VRLSRNPDNRITQEQARTQLRLLLANATDRRIEDLTIEMLTHMYRVPPREIECLLLAEQDKRRRRAMTQPI